MSINDMSSNTRQNASFIDGRASLGPSERQGPEIIETSLLEAGKLWETLLEKKWLIILVTILSLLLGIFLSLKVEPTYKANALIEIDANGKKDLGVLGKTFSAGPGKMSITSDIEVMNSRMVLRNVVDELNLQISVSSTQLPYVGSVLTTFFDGDQLLPIYKSLGFESYAVGGEWLDIAKLELPEMLASKYLTVKTLSESRYNVYTHTGDLLLEDAKTGELVTMPTGDGDHILLQVNTIRAHQGVEFTVKLKPLVQSVSNLKSNFDVAEKAKNSGILRLTYESNDAERSAEILNAIVNSFLYQSVEKYSEQTKRSLEFIEEQLPLVKRKLEASERAYNDYRVNYGSVDLEAETQSILKKTEALETEILGLELRRSELRLLYKDNHPEIVSLDKKISNLKNRQVSLEQRFGNMPDAQQDIISLEREVNVNTALYTKMQSVAQELRVAKAGAVGHVRVIDYALAPSSAQPDSAKLVIVVVTLLGLFGSITAIGLFRALQGGKINDTDDIESLGLPVLASISRSSVQSKISQIVHKNSNKRKVHALSLVDPDDAAVECLRSLRTVVQTHSKKEVGNIIVISGPSPFAGKSFVSLNLAILLAKTGSRVLLLDADMRRGHIHTSLSLKSSPGFSNVLTGEQQDVVQETDIEGLHFIATGSRSNRPADHLSSASVHSKLLGLVDSYDYIVVDTPPILAVSDAATIAQYADLLMLVVREGDATKKMLLQSVKAFKRANVIVDGIVFNGVPKSKSNYIYDYS